MKFVNISPRAAHRADVTAHAALKITDTGPVCRREGVPGYETQ